MTDKTCGTCAKFFRDGKHIGICRDSVGYGEIGGTDAYTAVWDSSDESNSLCRGLRWIDRHNSLEAIAKEAVRAIQCCQEDKCRHCPLEGKRPFCSDELADQLEELGVEL